MSSIEHLPVLLAESLAFLATGHGGLFVDCTVGSGGHSEALLESSDLVQLIGIDRDQEALHRAQSRLARFGDRVRLLHGNYSDVASLLRSVGVSKVTGVLADLGVSSQQLEDAERGFSFRSNGPLDMRMDPSRGATARDILDQVSESELQRILREYGEERQARRIARAIVEARVEGSIESTSELRDVVHRAVGRSRVGGGRHRVGGIDSATRTFQALRIEVNQELSGIERFVDSSIEMLETEGRLVVISYHSLEDRIIKVKLRDSAVGVADPVTGRRPNETRLIELLTKKPVRPTDEEVSSNPRARSARLRAARRLSS